MGVRAGVAALCAALATASSASAAAPPRPGAAFVSAWYQARVAHIQPIGELWAGPPDVDAGSGLLIGDSYVLTASHLIPEAYLYKTLTLNVRLGSNRRNPVTAHLVERDAAHDLALLQLDAPVHLPRPPCPIEGVTDEHLVPVGSLVFVIGFPVNQDQIITQGIIEGRREDGRWFTQAAINPGNSGGPVFSEQGYLVGVAEGASRKFDRGGGPGKETNVEGINVFVPASAILAGPIGARLRLEPTCWMDHRPSADELSLIDLLNGISNPRPGAPPGGEGSAPAAASTSALIASLHQDFVLRPIAGGESGGGRAPASSGQAEYAATWMRSPEIAARLAALSAASRDSKPLTTAEKALLPRDFAIAFPVRLTHGEHSDSTQPTKRTFAKVLQAEDGYRIIKCLPDAWRSDHAAAATCKIAPGGRSATFTVDLSSGPTADAWQGIWEGAVKLQQKR